MLSPYLVPAIVLIHYLRRKMAFTFAAVVMIKQKTDIQDWVSSSETLRLDNPQHH